MGPKLQAKVEPRSSVERGRERYEHPVEDEWHERGDYETYVNHAVRGEGEPTVLSIFCDSIALRLLRSGNGTTGIFSSDTNTEEESKVRRCGSKKRRPGERKK